MAHPIFLPVGLGTSKARPRPIKASETLAATTPAPALSRKPLRVIPFLSESEIIASSSQAPICPTSYGLCYEIDLCGVWNDASRVSHVQQAAHRFAAVGAVIQRALVHVHANELIRQLGIEVSSELHGVR